MDFPIPTIIWGSLVSGAPFYENMVAAFIFPFPLVFGAASRPVELSLDCPDVIFPTKSTRSEI
jgi:hypothetical protein